MVADLVWIALVIKLLAEGILDMQILMFVALICILIPRMLFKVAPSAGMLAL